MNDKNKCSFDCQTSFCGWKNILLIQLNVRTQAFDLCKLFSRIEAEGAGCNVQVVLRSEMWLYSIVRLQYSTELLRSEPGRGTEIEDEADIDGQLCWTPAYACHVGKSQYERPL